MTYSKPAERTTAEMARTVADEGWSVVGVLDRLLSRRLLRAVDEVAARSPDASTAGQLHQLSGLAQHPDLAAVVDWPPLLALVVELLSPNVYLTDVESPDDGALEVVPCSHLDTMSRYPTEEQPDGVPILGPAGTVAVFDARLWHRRRDNLGTRIRRAMFMAYSYRWLTSRDIPFENVPEWASLPRIRRQLLGDKTVDPFYWASGELPLDPRSTGLQEAA
jgi:ectoine hydroxylase-related dioxygenase (phytanoyl-CoA dioxygenase family)